jgi:hypothetical protein
MAVAGVGGAGRSNLTRIAWILALIFAALVVDTPVRA